MNDQSNSGNCYVCGNELKYYCPPFEYLMFDEKLQKVCPYCRKSSDLKKPFVFNDTNDLKEIHGYIGHYHLGNWWLTQFTAAERKKFEEIDFLNHDPSDEGEIIYSWSSDGNEEDYWPGKNFFTGHIYATRGTPVNVTEPAGAYLSVLTSSFATDLLRPLQIKIANKAKELLDETVRLNDSNNDAMLLHFCYGELMSTFYRSRDKDSDSLQNAISCAESMIKIAPKAIPGYLKIEKGKLPVHAGYKQLAIIRDKQRDYAEAIRLCNQAMEQGWDGDWEKRIERYQKKLSKSAADL